MWSYLYVMATYLFLVRSKRLTAHPTFNSKRSKRSYTLGPESAVYLHLTNKGRSCDDNDVHILDREDWWCERGVREAIYVHGKIPPATQGGCHSAYLCGALYNQPDHHSFSARLLLSIECVTLQPFFLFSACSQNRPSPSDSAGFYLLPLRPDSVCLKPQLAL